MTGRRTGAIVGTFLAAMALAGCGYHLGGKAALIPADVKTIAIPPFGNGTVRYQLARLLPADITREFHSRTHYVIVTDPNEADAVLAGVLANFVSVSGTTGAQGNGPTRTTGAQVIVTVRLTLTDRRTGKVLFSRPGFEYRERYEVSIDPVTYFDESGTAISRLSQEVARSVVTAILEAF